MSLLPVRVEGRSTEEITEQYLAKEGECRQLTEPPLTRKERWDEGHGKVMKSRSGSGSLDDAECEDVSAIVSPVSESSLLEDALYNGEKQSLQSQQRDMLLGLQSLNCSPELLESVERFLS